MSTSVMAARYTDQTYVIRRKVFQLFGASFQIFDQNGQPAFFSRQKAFKLREDIRVYADERQEQEVLSIVARSIIDFSSAYDVFDPTTGEKVGVLCRRGWQSLLRDEWQIANLADQVEGEIREDSLPLALVRRFGGSLGNMIPQSFTGTIGGQPVCEFRQHFNPFVQKITMDFSADTGGRLDRRLGLAAGILLCAIERRQQEEGPGQLDNLSFDNL